MRAFVKLAQLLKIMRLEEKLIFRRDSTGPSLANPTGPRTDPLRNIVLCRLSVARKPS